MQTVETLRGAIEKALRNIHYPERPDGLFAPVRYALESGGKRLRPVLLLAVYDWLHGGKGDIETALSAACAVEVFHNFTLLHDDIMDDSALRRGRPTVQAQYGQNVAILSGDAMSVLAYQLLASAPTEQLAGLLQRFNRLAMGVCQGQQWDMEFETRESVSREEYLLMVQYKTAELIEGAVRMGAYQAKATTQLEEHLAGFARAVGIAFQLQDDLLDTYGNTQTLGKECGDDIMDDKKTYLSILAYEAADAAQLKELRQCAQQDSLPRSEKIARVRAVFDALDVQRSTENEIATRLQQADTHLQAAEQMVGRSADTIRALFSSLHNRKY